MENLLERLTGEYYIHNITEVATGFKLNRDMTFNFFFSYGALDRYGEGNWEICDNQIILNSKKWIGRDFQLIESNLTKQDKIIIEIIECNEAIKSFFWGSIADGKQDTWKNTQNDGYIIFEMQDFNSICLAFEFCQERFSLFSPVVKKHNHFRFKPETWLFDYFFNNFTLEISEEGLSGRHPILNDDDYLYSKNK